MEGGVGDSIPRHGRGPGKITTTFGVTSEREKGKKETNTWTRLGVVAAKMEGPEFKGGKPGTGGYNR